MKLNPLAIIIFTILISSLHMIAPDHWVPLNVLSIRRRFNYSTIMLISGLLGFLHSFVSVLLSLVLVYIGLNFFNFIDIKYFSVSIIFVVCIYILLSSLREVKENRNVEATSLIVSVLPDPAILPLIISSSSMGLQFLLLIIILFIITSTISLSLVTSLVNKGFLKALSRLKPYLIDYLIVSILIITAAYILLG
ncbi:hypothetical protein [Caldisphaera sp.]|uniref:hypothetical protein n=1 Tax=Caldisphaera sp. TaxID=2060322 RepID=UPI0025C2B8B5|nr:hypothetical protein [Caldisphaera sp.]